MIPPLRWIGGKRFMAPAIAEVYHAKKHKRIIEPFAGSAALFHMLEPRRAVLNDMCVPLVNFYRQVKKNPVEFGNAWLYFARKYKQPSPKNYYRIRKMFNEECSNDRERALCFLYLNRVCFHGLWRVNRAGHMNAAYEHCASPKMPSCQDLFELGLFYKNVRIMLGDFEQALKLADLGDFVYCDPPYCGAFDMYTERPFDEEDHVRLESLACTAITRGATVVITNSNERFVRKLYKSVRWERVKIPSTQRIAPQNNRGGRKPEVIIIGRS